MLTSLKIQNLILIRQAEISLGPGLNILTGETGSGKSAILAAIRLICGERAEAQLIRKGSSLAIVEAILTSYSPDHFLAEGIDPPLPGQPVRIRREIHLSGKSRCFVEDQQTSLSFLRKCVGSSIERVDQSSSAALCSPEEQRKMLDSYADLSSEADLFAYSFNEEKTRETQFQTLLQSQAQKERELEWAHKDLEAIREVDWQSGEEENLNQEHHLLNHAQELAEKISAASSVLTDGLPAMKRCLGLLESCGRIDGKLHLFAESMKSALLELEEIDRSLHSYADRLEADPQRLQAVEQRMAAIESLKRKFGRSQIEVEARKESLIAQIDRLTHLDSEIEEVQVQLKQLKEKNQRAAETISRKRKSAAGDLADLVLKQLKSLNLPHARFEIAIGQKPISPNGIDEIRFLFSANPGAAPIPLENCASGGELSRLLLAIKTVLAEKEKSSCLIFDEIDSNVGGQTAAILGEKLKKLSQSRQVICVTHFVQVARCAMHHFLVSKAEENGTAVTSISQLSSKEREKEFSRMLGSI